MSVTSRCFVCFELIRVFVVRAVLSWCPWTWPVYISSVYIWFTAGFQHWFGYITVVSPFPADYELPVLVSSIRKRDRAGKGIRHRLSALSSINHCKECLLLQLKMKCQLHKVDYTVNRHLACINILYHIYLKLFRSTTCCCVFEANSASSNRKWTE